MNSLRLFEEFLADGVVKKQSPNYSRSKSLAEEAEVRNNFLAEMIAKMKVSDQNANYFVETAYDIILEMIRAKMLLEGYNASGSYAHEAEVAYLRDMKFTESEVRFANELRYFRNGINYYGKRLDAEYAGKVISFLNKEYPKLKGMLD